MCCDSTIFFLTLLVDHAPAEISIRSNKLCALDRREFRRACLRFIINCSSGYNCRGLRRRHVCKRLLGNGWDTDGCRIVSCIAISYFCLCYINAWKRLVHQYCIKCVNRRLCSKDCCPAWRNCRDDGNGSKNKCQYHRQKTDYFF